MINLRILFALVLLSGSALFAAHGSDNRQQVMETITSEEVMSYVHELVRPEYLGRLAGSPEYMEVACWVARQLQEWGIKPLGDDGSYFQNFPWPYTRVRSVGSLLLHRGGEQWTLTAPNDYYPGANSANGTTHAQVVFAGYGISAPELNYDDFAGMDVKGKIVMIAGGTPYRGNHPDTLNMWGPYSGSVYKMENAYLKGAAGVLYLDKLANPGAPYFDDFRYAHIDNSVAEKILNSPLADVLGEIRQSVRPNSFSTDFEATLASDTEFIADGNTANVIGYLPGYDPELKHEAIILGAHLDGQGNLGFHFEGALDNASGVADVMAAARALAQFRGQMKRSVVFIFFGAEEVGLVGSIHYCKNPAFSQENTLLFMNLDMVGNGQGLALWHGESYPEIYTHFARNNQQFIGRNLRTSPGNMPAGRPRTDGAVFMQHGFRTLHVGTTDRVNPMYYHDPRDVASNLVPDIMRDVSRLLFLGVLDLANDNSIRANELNLIR